jgi:transglutaminase-like putative cysteine protease
MSSRWIVALLMLLLAQGVAAQTPPEQPKLPEFPFEPANAVTKYDCTLVQLEADGKSNTLHHYRIALFTDRAVRRYAQDETVYNVNYDTVEILTARVHLPSGRIVEVGPEAIKDVPMPAFGKFFLQNVREKIITFPELSKGAEIEIAYREITRDPPMENNFDFSEPFEYRDPLQNKYVEITAPVSMPLKWKARGGDIPCRKTAEGDRVRYVWSLENVPQLVPEPGMPPSPEVARRLFVTTVNDWKTWSRWYSDLSQPEMVADEDVRRTVNELTAGKNSVSEKLDAIFYFVSNHIRYVETALSGRKAGYKPESASVTLRNKYGVCRDKAALMVTMLREAGIPSDIVLMNPVWKIDGEIPVDQFNHAIVAAYLDGKRVWVDPTVEKTKDYLAANEQDRAVLICDETGEDLQWTPLEPSEQNLYQIRAESTLDPQGGFQSQVTISTRGLPDLILRNALQSMQPERRENLFKQLVQAIHPTAVIDSLQISDLLDFQTNVTIRLALHATDYAVEAGRYLLFKVPGQEENLDFLTSHFLNGAEMTQRRYDLRLQSTFAVRVEESVRFPEGYRVRSLPENVDLNYGDFRMARQVSSGRNRVLVKRVMDFSTLNVPLSEYGKLQDMLRKRQTMARGQVILMKG